MQRPAEAVADLRQAVAKGFNHVAGMKARSRFE